MARSGRTAREHGYLPTTDGASPAAPEPRRRHSPEEQQAALVQMRSLLQDPDLTPDVVARVILGVLRKELSYGAWNTYRRDGRGAVLVDLRQLADGQVTKQYISEDALRAMDVRDGPLAGLEEAMEPTSHGASCWSLFDSPRRWAATA